MGCAGCSLSAAHGGIRSLTLHKLNRRLKKNASANNDVQSPVNILCVSGELMNSGRMILLSLTKRRRSLKLWCNGDAKPSDVLIRFNNQNGSSSSVTVQVLIVPSFCGDSKKKKKKKKKQKQIALQRLVMFHKDEAACLNVQTLLTFLFTASKQKE